MGDDKIIVYGSGNGHIAERIPLDGEITNPRPGSILGSISDVMHDPVLWKQTHYLLFAPTSPGVPGIIPLIFYDGKRVYDNLVTLDGAADTLCRKICLPDARAMNTLSIKNPIAHKQALEFYQSLGNLSMGNEHSLQGIVFNYPHAGEDGIPGIYNGFTGCPDDFRLTIDGYLIDEGEIFQPKDPVVPITIGRLPKEGAPLLAMVYLNKPCYEARARQGGQMRLPLSFEHNRSYFDANGSPREKVI